VRVRFRNDGGKDYARGEVHLVYRAAGGGVPGAVVTAIRPPRFDHPTNDARLRQGMVLHPLPHVVAAQLLMVGKAIRAQQGDAGHGSRAERGGVFGHDMEHVVFRGSGVERRCGREQRLVRREDKCHVDADAVVLEYCEGKAYMDIPKGALPLQAIANIEGIVAAMHACGVRRLVALATVADLEEFFNLLPNGDRQFVILPGTAHSVALATNRQLFWHVTRSFLSMPAPIAT